VDDLWATKSEDVGLIDRLFSFQDFQPLWSWSTNVTVRLTDRRMRLQDHALHYSASCGKNNGLTTMLMVTDQKQQIFIQRYYYSASHWRL